MDLENTALKCLDVIDLVHRGALRRPEVCMEGLGTLFEVLAFGDHDQRGNSTLIQMCLVHGNVPEADRIDGVGNDRYHSMRVPQRPSYTGTAPAICHRPGGAL